MVINIGALKARDLELVAGDIRGVVSVSHAGGAIVKVIIEAVLLTDEEKTIACLLSKEAGADFVKTSTGFASGGATVHDVELMRRTVGPEMGVKAAGGVRTYEDAENMLKAGATRIGASAGVKIIQGPSKDAAAAAPVSTTGKELLGERHVDRKSDRNDRFNDQRRKTAPGVNCSSCARRMKAAARPGSRMLPWIPWMPGSATWC